MIIFGKKLRLRLQVQNLASIFDSPLLTKTSNSILEGVAVLIVIQKLNLMHRIRTWKQFAILLLCFTAIVSCKKHRPADNTNPPPENPPPSSAYEALLGFPGVAYCDSALTSNLKIQDGTDIGTVTVGNDAVYLYLTYDLSGNWYIGDVQCYAGQQLGIPRGSDGNPSYNQFPGKQALNFCDLRQTFTFKVPLSTLTSDNGQCSTNVQYYIAMRASVKDITNPANCSAGIAQAAWGAPFLINPGNSNEWATAFYYCKQDCSKPSVTWCAYSQGYWFTKKDVAWCQNVKFGALEVTRAEGVALWPPQNNWIKKAFFQASALQLSMNCVNGGNAIPASISSDYNSLGTFLSTLTYTDIQTGTAPPGADSTAIKVLIGNVGKWICQNHCTSASDPTACSGF